MSPCMCVYMRVYIYFDESIKMRATTTTANKKETKNNKKKDKSNNNDKEMVYNSYLTRLK